jgi:hypothetical protein
MFKQKLSQKIVMVCQSFFFPRAHQNVPWQKFEYKMTATRCGQPALTDFTPANPKAATTNTKKKHVQD